MNLIDLIINKIMPKMGLNPTGSAFSPKEGRIAHNIIVPTMELGEVLFRCYPVESSKSALGYGVERAKFELKVLVFLAENGAPTPKPVKLLQDKKYAVEEDGWFVFTYIIEEGQTLNQNNLNKTFAFEAGALLSKIRQVSDLYQHEGNEPNGDLLYIKNILNNFLTRRLDMANNQIFYDMFALLSNASFIEELLATPEGLVHGDFYFENVLVKKDHLMGVIDFGDAYYGYQLMDVAIGSMEFAMKINEHWDFTLYGAFINANRNWLTKHKISFNVFHYTLLANCCRFTAHICNLTQDELDQNSNSNAPIDLVENPYVKRFYMFQEPEIINQLRVIYEENLL